jgi:tripartite-type tricarboxylate transporter receptor subunit TctC
VKAISWYDGQSFGLAYVPRYRWRAMSIMVSAASAQDKWPSRRVTIVVPFAAGSNTDACARLLADLLERHLWPAVHR